LYKKTLTDRTIIITSEAYTNTV